MKVHAILVRIRGTANTHTHVLRTKPIPEISKLDQCIKMALSASKVNHKYKYILQPTIFKGVMILGFRLHGFQGAQYMSSMPYVQALHF